MTSESIPAWIKQAVGLWSDGNTPDENFYSVVDYLMEYNIIMSNNEKNTVSTIPHWFQKNAHLWVTNEIDDNTFVGSIQYLISAGIIS